MGYATCLELFMKEEVKNFDMCYLFFVVWMPWTEWAVNLLEITTGDTMLMWRHLGLLSMATMPLKLKPDVPIPYMSMSIL